MCLGWPFLRELEYHHHHLQVVSAHLISIVVLLGFGDLRVKKGDLRVKSVNLASSRVERLFALLTPSPFPTQAPVDRLELTAVLVLRRLARRRPPPLRQWGESTGWTCDYAAYPQALHVVLEYGDGYRSRDALVGQLGQVFEAFLLQVFELLELTLLLVQGVLRTQPPPPIESPSIPSFWSTRSILLPLSLVSNRSGPYLEIFHPCPYSSVQLDAQATNACRPQSAPLPLTALARGGPQEGGAALEASDMLEQGRLWYVSRVMPRP
jgi:hypothetical protein